MALDALLEESTSFQCEKCRKMWIIFSFSDKRVLFSAYTLKIGNSLSLFPVFCEKRIYIFRFFFNAHTCKGKPIDASEPFFQEREGEDQSFDKGDSGWTATF